MSKIKELHIFGVKGIIDILITRGTFKKFPFYFSIILSLIIVVIVSFFYAEKSFDFVTLTSDMLLAFFPNLLGFSLGGYALVVGFSNVDLIKKGSDVNKHSLYQILNAIFSLSIIFQVFVTILCFSVGWFIKISLEINLPYDFGCLSNFVNAIVLWLMLFGSIYSLFLTPYVITNLFTLSQLNNLHLTIEKLKENTVVKNKDEISEKNESK